MPSDLNWKTKYQELKLKFMNCVDVSFRLGFEAGAQQQIINTQTQAQELGQPGQEDAPSMDQNGSELDQHISKLEGMLGNNPEPEIQKSLQAIISLRKNEKDAIEMKKSELAIKGIAKALHKPEFKIGVQAAHNLTDNAKKAISLQHKIVNDVMAKWEEEESKANKDIKNILNVEGLLKE